MDSRYLYIGHHLATKRSFRQIYSRLEQGIVIDGKIYRTKDKDKNKSKD